ncbi:bifunctional acetate--CoA ligase family protein/GNAT family N-acetyltransferase [Ancylobacter terrae]|uniref:bifunctional acetate--CoA ligase family protein/GNAT family N-acetyltransferase n=1 Tax=Ancylobacter sp. sgz301288 TaxID=3342077 RepID=UPI00385FC26C
MSIYRLDKLFAPASVAVIGASPRPGSLGCAVLSNLIAGGFRGRIYPVNPRYADIDGIACVPTIAELVETPDLIVIVTPPATIPGIVETAGRRGVAAAIVISTGLGHGPGSLAEATRAAARAHGMRLVGPNCLGTIAPGGRLDASFAGHAAQRGDLALISQSGGLAGGLLRWAERRKVGFSAVVTLGDMLDVDFGDCLDWFARDGATRAILLYVESIEDARKFMSAARDAARSKPVVVIKAGRHVAGAKAAATHTGAMAGSDAVYEAAFRRAGLIRVRDLDELFVAAETLGRRRAFRGDRLSILTNGGGLGVLAVDRLADFGGRLAELAPATMAALDAAMPATWSGTNPVDIVGDADAPRYAAALQALLADPGTDAVAVLQVPTALASATDVAEAVADVVKRQPGGGKPAFAVWLGGDERVAPAFEAAGISSYATEADAIAGFMHLVRYREAREALMRTPDEMPADTAPDLARARAIVDGALAEQRRTLSPVEVGGLLEAYRIPAVPVRLAADAEEAAAAADPFLAGGGAVAIKILSPDIVHKSDVDGVVLDLSSVEAVRAAARRMLEAVASRQSGSRIAGIIVQPMIRRPQARELIVGIADDPTFGPVIAFGRGGVAVEVIGDRAIALPPLDLNLARDLIGRTRVARLLASYRNIAAADGRAVELVLVRLAQMAADLPEIAELDINPLLADADGVLALDARVVLAVSAPGLAGVRHARFAVRPYPSEWERRITVRRGAGYFVRPVRPEDEAMFRAFIDRVSDEDLRLRFFAPVRNVGHDFLAALVQIDYARSMAFVALDGDEMAGVVRLHADADHRSGEYAILVRSDLKGTGLGWALMRLIIEWAEVEGISRVEGQILRSNTPMIELCGDLGFLMRPDPEDPAVVIATLAVGTRPATAATDQDSRPPI